jgi:fluoride ion exporter CrcB/FEX
VVGCGLRYATGLLLASWLVPWPWATLLVNGLGALLIGVALGLGGGKLNALPDGIRLAVVVGGLGGLTTFSGLLADCYKLYQLRPWWALVYWATTNGGGLVLLWFGLLGGQWWRNSH